ncbi:MAG: hypothetical protein SGI73_12480 [Chloroflexota bacterium]|nr:hypothetical protein [Chloroflexota bacterium]
MALHKAVGLGTLAGMRSMVALATVRDDIDLVADGVDESIINLLRTPTAERAMKMMAVGEMIIDKLPFTPARTAPAPLIGRAVIGAMLGMMVTPEDRRRGAIVGALSAVVGAVAMYGARKNLHNRYGVPDPILGMMEDAAVVALTRALAREEHFI